MYNVSPKPSNLGCFEEVLGIPLGKNNPKPSVLGEFVEFWMNLGIENENNI